MAYGLIGHLFHLAADDPAGFNVAQLLANTGAVGVLLGLFLFTNRVRTGNDYDSLKEQMEARLAAKDTQIEAQAAIIRGFQAATYQSQSALARSTQVIEAIPDKETLVLDEVRGLLQRLEQVADPKGRTKS